MRILAVLTYYYPHWTGLTGSAQRVAEGLAARGHSISVLTYQHDPALPLHERHANVEIIRVPPLAQISRGMLSPRFLRRAAQLVRTHDVVHIHTPLLESGSVAALAHRAGRPVVVTHHGDLILPRGFANRIIERTAVSMMTLAGHLAQRVTTYSSDYAEHSDFLQRFAAKLTPIYPPVCIPEPSVQAARIWRAQLGLSEKRIVGFAGRFVEEKGFDILLRALPALRAACPNVHLLYAGDHRVVYERFYARCAPLIEPQRDRVTMLGLLRDRQQLADFYAMCDVLAVPSRSDCFAVVQVEAMLCGTPVVTSDIAGAREAIRVGRMGRLVRAGDPGALTEGLLDVLERPDSYRRSRAEIEAHFDARRSRDAYERTLADVAGTGRGRGSVTVAPAASRSRDIDGGLTADDRARLDRLLSNEADMAYRRRVPLLLGYLELHDGDVVLDCGCGMGFHSKAIGQLRRVRVVAQDRATDRLQQARRYGTRGLVCGDTQCLPVGRDRIDKVLLSEVLEHLEDDRTALREVHRVLRPGGILALSVPHANYPFWWDPINAVWTATGGAPIRNGPIAGIWSNHRRLYWPHDLTERVESAGFTVEVLQEATHHCVPFSHFLVYGLAKPLLEKGLLPHGWRRHADRMTGDDNDASPLHPLNLARAALRWVDRPNDRSTTRPTASFVSLLVKARKPE